MEFLKEYLSEETYAKVAEELTGRSIKLADLSKGEYVSKDKYSALEGKESELRQQLIDKTNAYDDLLTKAGNNEALKTELENLKTSSRQQLDGTIAAYQQKLRDAAIRSALIQAKAKDATDIIGQLDYEKIQFADDELTGLAEQLENLKAAKPYLFIEDEHKRGKGGLDHGGADSAADENSIRAVLGLPPIQ